MCAPLKRNVAGIEISTTSYDEVVACCERWVENRRNGEVTPSRYICVTSVHGVITARDDASVRRILNAADIATPDGMPLVWALRSFGFKNQQRVYGPRLMLHLCANAERKGHRIFLYGGTDERLLQLRARLLRRFPDLLIAGWYAPPFRDLTAEEACDVERRILESGADLCFVGVSTPKQEHFMFEHRERLPGVIMIGVGAAFDFHAGRVRQAPDWMQRAGLEWFFRLAMEPARLWRRYLLVTPRFLPLWGWQLWRESRAWPAPVRIESRPVENPGLTTEGAPNQ